MGNETRARAACLAPHERASRRTLMQETLGRAHGQRVQDETKFGAGSVYRWGLAVARFRFRATQRAPGGSSFGAQKKLRPALETSEPLGGHMVGFWRQLSRLSPGALMGVPGVSKKPTQVVHSFPAPAMWIPPGKTQNDHISFLKDRQHEPAGRVVSGRGVCGRLVCGRLVCGRQVRGRPKSGRLVCGRLMCGDQCAGDQGAGDLCAGDLRAGD